MPAADIDQVREYWNRRPCNVRHSPKPVGSPEYFHEVEVRKYRVEPHIPGFAQFERWRGKRVLEIGGGIGTDSINFARHGADLSVVELSEQSLELCRRRFDVLGLSARFYLGNGEDLRSFVPVEPYDLVYSFGVIHHTPRPEKVIAELAHFCGPGTELRVMLYSKWSWKVLSILLAHGPGGFWRARQLVSRYSEAQEGCPVTHIYSFRDVRTLLLGFRVVDIRKEHIFPYVISRYIRHEYAKVWYFRWMPATLFRWLERRLGWHTLVVAKRDTRG